MRRCSNSIHKRRGAATVEAVVALPFLVIVLLSILYVRDQYVAKQAAALHARTCAWLYSANGCSSVPAGCTDTKPYNATTPIDSILSNALGDAAEGAKDAAMNMDLESIGGVVAEAIRGIFTEILANLFRKNARAVGRAPFSRPGLYGGGDYWMLHTTTLACNLVPKDPEDIVSDTFGKVFP